MRFLGFLLDKRLQALNVSFDFNSDTILVLDIKYSTAFVSSYENKNFLLKYIPADFHIIFTPLHEKVRLFAILLLVRIEYFMQINIYSRVLTLKTAGSFFSCPILVKTELDQGSFHSLPQARPSRHSDSGRRGGRSVERNSMPTLGDYQAQLIRPVLVLSQTSFISRPFATFVSTNVKLFL